MRPCGRLQLSLHTLCMCRLPHTQQLVKDMKMCGVFSYCHLSLLISFQIKWMCTSISSSLLVCLFRKPWPYLIVDFVHPVSCFNVKHGTASVVVSPPMLGNGPAVLNTPVPGHKPTGLQGTPGLNSQPGSAEAHRSAPHTAAVMGWWRKGSAHTLQCARQMPHWKEKTLDAVLSLKTGKVFTILRLSHQNQAKVHAGTHPLKSDENVWQHHPSASCRKFKTVLVFRKRNQSTKTWCRKKLVPPRSSLTLLCSALHCASWLEWMCLNVCDWCHCVLAS